MTAYQRVQIVDRTMDEDGPSGGAPFMPPIEQIRRLKASDVRLVPRANDTTNKLLDSIFVHGLRASYKRRLILTLDDTPGFHRVMAALTRANVSVEIANIMIEVLFGMVQLGVQKIDESIERERAEKANERLKIDPKTGLLGQAAFDEYAPALFDRLVQEGRIVSYIVFDIDGFKRVNDGHGHPAGDYVLREIGKIISGQLRSDDTAARDGGDELAVILPDTSLREAVLLAERIRKAVEFHEFIYNGKALNVTLSVGVGMRQEGDTFGDLHRRTDGLECISKAKGGNLISIAVLDSTDISTFPDSVNIVPSAENPN